MVGVLLLLLFRGSMRSTEVPRVPRESEAEGRSKTTRTVSLPELRAEDRQGFEGAKPTADREMEEVVRQSPTVEERELITGLVVGASEGGRPVSGARVFLNDPMSPVTVATTDKAGRFWLDAPAEELFSLSIRRKGYAFESWHRYELEVLQDGEGVYVLPIREGAELSGKVVDNHGAPVSSGRIVAYNEDGWKFLYRPSLVRGPARGEDPLRHTDFFSKFLFDRGEPIWMSTHHPFAELAEDGSFELGDLPAEAPIYLFVEAESVKREFHRVELLVGEQREAVVYVSRAPLVRGRLHRPSYPIQYPGVWFCLHEVEHPLQGFSVGLDRWAPAASDGSFSSGPLWPSDEVRMFFTFEAVDPGGALRHLQRELSVALGEEEQLELEVDLSQGMTPSELPARARR